jgi:hypothetical protein
LPFVVWSLNSYDVPLVSRPAVHGLLEMGSGIGSRENSPTPASLVHTQ